MPIRAVLVVIATMVVLVLAGCKTSQPAPNDLPAGLEQGAASNQPTAPVRVDHAAEVAAQIAAKPELAQYKEFIDRWVKRWRSEDPGSDGDWSRRSRDECGVAAAAMIIYGRPGIEQPLMPDVWEMPPESSEIIRRLQPYMRQGDFEMSNISIADDTINRSGKCVQASFVAHPLDATYGDMGAEHVVTLEFKKHEASLLLSKVFFETSMERRRQQHEKQDNNVRMASRIQKALDKMYADCGFYPDCLDELTYGKSHYSNVTPPAGWNGPYLDEIPRMERVPGSDNLFGWSYDPLSGKVKP